MINLLTQLGIPFRQVGEHKNVRQGYVGVDCPRCGPGSERFHCGINLEGKFASCWQCGRIRLGDLLMELTRESWPIVLGWIESLRGQSTVVSATVDISGQYKFPGTLQPLSDPYKRYLRSARGFDPQEIIDRWKVQATGPVGQYSWRLFLPIRMDGVPVSWTTRHIGNHSLRYISAKPSQESVPHKNLLYGEDFARHAIVICEGPIDAWAIGPGGVATMGLTWTPAQLLRMTRYSVRAVCFDSTVAAQRRARKLATILSGYPGETTMVEIESGEDAAAADLDEIGEIRKMFLNYFENS